MVFHHTLKLICQNIYFTNYFLIKLQVRELLLLIIAVQNYGCSMDVLEVNIQKIGQIPKLTYKSNSLRMRLNFVGHITAEEVTYKK